MPESSSQQFWVLYRHFLFRLMDVELLAADARGDSSRLLGQFASLLLFISVLLALGGLTYTVPQDPGTAALTAWRMEHLLLTLTMLTVGIFAVLNWEATLLEKRDVFILGPLPVSATTLIFAKVAAVASALALTVFLLNGLDCTAWAIAISRGQGELIVTIRTVACFWTCILLAGAFIYSIVLGLQAVVSLLPRQWYLRASTGLQLALFASLVGVFLLEPSIVDVKLLHPPRTQATLLWFPSYWFLGLMNWTAGIYAAAAGRLMACLAQRALVGIACVLIPGVIVWLGSYIRTLQKVMEEPDITPALHPRIALPKFGPPPQTALTHFAARTLTRSRQHRLTLMCFLGLGAGLATVCLSAATNIAQVRGEPSSGAPMLLAAALLLLAMIVGLRAGFAVPLELRANWVFRIVPTTTDSIAIRATRRVMQCYSVLPVCVASAAVFSAFSPATTALKYALTMYLLGTIIIDVSLLSFRKIPFACSYLPGKANIHIRFWFGVYVLTAGLPKYVELEEFVVGQNKRFWIAMIVLLLVAVMVRLSTRLVRRQQSEVEFEETETDKLVVLGITGD